MRVTPRASIVTAATAVMLIAGAASADEGAIKHRQAVMKAIGGHTGAVAAIVKRQVPFTDDAKVHADALADLSQIVPRIFPEGSVGDSGTLPAVWDKPDEFKAAVAEFQTAAAGLAKAAVEGPSAVPAALGALGKSCKGCHDDFRKKK